MDLFASDLDNTLIYSYKRDLGTDTVCAEVDEGRKVSFMTNRSRELLEKVNQTMHFVPVTTRSVQQYQRIRFGDTWSPHLALAANGGVLLRDELFENGVKVYVVPRVLNKGTGVRRLREWFPEARVFAAQGVRRAACAQ